jgi:hypothetical protein
MRRRACLLTINISKWLLSSLTPYHRSLRAFIDCGLMVQCMVGDIWKYWRLAASRPKSALMLLFDTASTCQLAYLNAEAIKLDFGASKIFCPILTSRRRYIDVCDPSDWSTLSLAIDHTHCSLIYLDSNLADAIRHDYESTTLRLASPAGVAVASPGPCTNSASEVRWCIIGASQENRLISTTV